MLAALAGDTAAYDRLLRYLADLIGKYVRRRISQTETADEIVQDILLRIHAFRTTWNPSLKIEPWIFTIARNTIIDYFRTNARKYAFLVTGVESPDPLELGTPEAQLLLDEAFSQLTAEQSEILHMAKVEGLSLEDVAGRTGLSLSAVKVRVHRAMKALVGKISDDTSDG